jgi:citrate synthase
MKTRRPEETASPGWMPAAEAAGALGVNRATLYAYVSRGYVRSQPAPGATRQRWYARDDVERLRGRAEARHDPDKAAARALQWGVPILESAIALIDGERLYYRGHDAVVLARTRSIAEIASLIWTGGFERAFPGPVDPLGVDGQASAGELSFLPRAQTALAAASERDPGAYDLRQDSVALTGWRILQTLTQVGTSLEPRGTRRLPAFRRPRPRSRRSARPGNSGKALQTEVSIRRERAGRQQDAPAIEQTLASAWAVSARGVDILRSAVILCADHELNVSSFTARCVASAGATPYAVALAGLAALGGVRHGGASARVESMLESVQSLRQVRSAVGERLRRGEPIDGFGHPLYRDGDPRATALLGLLADRYGASAELAFVDEFSRAAISLLREKPNIDFALAAVARVLRLPAGAPLALFAIGRTIGWIGHAIEQYSTGLLIRPRAKYVGAPPLAANTQRERSLTEV